MPLARSERQALKLGPAPLRILLPDREIRQGGVGCGGAMLMPSNLEKTWHMPDNKDL